MIDDLNPLTLKQYILSNREMRKQHLAESQKAVGDREVFEEERRQQEADWNREEAAYHLKLAGMGIIIYQEYPELVEASVPEIIAVIDPSNQQQEKQHWFLSGKLEICHDTSFAVEALKYDDPALFFASDKVVAEAERLILQTLNKRQNIPMMAVS